MRLRDHPHLERPAGRLLDPELEPGQDLRIEERHVPDRLPAHRLRAEQVRVRDGEPERHGLPDRVLHRLHPLPARVPIPALRSDHHRLRASFDRVRLPVGGDQPPPGRQRLSGTGGEMVGDDEAAEGAPGAVGTADDVGRIRRRPRRQEVGTRRCAASAPCRRCRRERSRASRRAPPSSRSSPSPQDAAGPVALARAETTWKETSSPSAGPPWPITDAWRAMPPGAGDAASPTARSRSSRPRTSAPSGGRGKLVCCAPEVVAPVPEEPVPDAGAVLRTEWAKSVIVTIAPTPAASATSAAPRRIRTRRDVRSVATVIRTAWSDQDVDRRAAGRPDVERDPPAADHDEGRRVRPCEDARRAARAASRRAAASPCPAW